MTTCIEKKWSDVRAYLEAWYPGNVGLAHLCQVVKDSAQRYFSLPLMEAKVQVKDDMVHIQAVSKDDTHSMSSLVKTVVDCFPTQCHFADMYDRALDKAKPTQSLVFLKSEVIRACDLQTGASAWAETCPG